MWERSSLNFFSFQSISGFAVSSQGMPDRASCVLIDASAKMIGPGKYYQMKIVGTMVI